MTVHPYRKPSAEPPPQPPGEELILYLALCTIGAIPVVISLASGGAFGVEATIGLLMALAGAVGIASLVAARLASARRAG